MIPVLLEVGLVAVLFAAARGLCWVTLTCVVLQSVSVTGRSW
jgi:hypothetical protein